MVLDLLQKLHKTQLLHGLQKDFWVEYSLLFYSIGVSTSVPFHLSCYAVFMTAYSSFTIFSPHCPNLESEKG